jgi:hypothetical protein
MATLEGVQVPGPPGPRTAKVTITVENQAGVDTPNKMSTPHTKVKWLLGDVRVPTTQISGEDASEEMHLSVEPQSASTSSPRTLEALAFMDFETSDMAVKDPDVKKILEDELRHQWKDETEQGFWPEIMECQQSEGCICWRCHSSCKLSSPTRSWHPFTTKSGIDSCCQWDTPL